MAMPIVSSGSGGSQLRRILIDVDTSPLPASAASIAACDDGFHNSARLRSEMPRRSAACGDISSSVPPMRASGSTAAIRNGTTHAATRDELRARRRPALRADPQWSRPSPPHRRRAAPRRHGPSWRRRPRAAGRWSPIGKDESGLRRVAPAALPRYTPTMPDAGRTSECDRGTRLAGCGHRSVGHVGTEVTGVVDADDVARGGCEPRCGLHGRRGGPIDRSTESGDRAAPIDDNEERCETEDETGTHDPELYGLRRPVGHHERNDRAHGRRFRYRRSTVSADMPTTSDPTADNDPPSAHTGSGLAAEKARRLAQLDDIRAAGANAVPLPVRPHAHARPGACSVGRPGARHRDRRCRRRRRPDHAAARLGQARSSPRFATDPATSSCSCRRRSSATTRFGAVKQLDLGDWVGVRRHGDDHPQGRAVGEGRAGRTARRRRCARCPTSGTA